MELYLLKSAACLTIFYVFYKAFLERESIHLIKRFYLLASLFAAFCIPFITFTTYVEVAAPVTSVALIASDGAADVSYVTAEPSVNYLTIALWSIYSLGVVIFGFRFFRNLFKIFQQIRTNPIYKEKGFFHVLLGTPVSPHTFFSYVFLYETAFKNNQIPSEVLIHEKAHAKQKHSLDILLIELLQVVFWFNPLLYFIKNSIKLNHEFLADQAVLKHGIATSHYQNILLAFSSNATAPIMANAINYSSIKKRFTVMKNQTSKRSVWTKSALLLPIVAIVLLSFSTSETITTIKKDSTSEVIQTDVTPKKIVAYNKMAAYWNEYFEENPADRNMPLSELTKLETIYRSMSVEQKKLAEPFPECHLKKNTGDFKATPKQLAEYNALAKKYNAMDRSNMTVYKKDVERLKYLYDLMSAEQRKNAEPFPSFPSPPPAPEAPKPPKVMKGEISNVPPPPPPPAPKDPIDHVIEMAKKGADFYLNGKKVPSDKAIDALKKNRDLNIQIRENNGKDEVVITTAAIQLKSSKQMASSNSNEAAQETDDVALIKKLAKEGAMFLLFDGGPHFKDGQKISLEKALEVVKNIEGLTIDIRDEGYIYKIVELRFKGC